MRCVCFALLLMIGAKTALAGAYSDVNCPGTGWPDWKCKAYTGCSDR